MKKTFKTFQKLRNKLLCIIKLFATTKENLLKTISKLDLVTQPEVKKYPGKKISNDSMDRYLYKLRVVAEMKVGNHFRVT